MSTREVINQLYGQRVATATKISSIQRGIDFLRDGSKTPDGKKMTEAHARAAFIFVCDALGLDAAETGEKFIEHFVSAKTDSPADKGA